MIKRLTIIGVAIGATFGFAIQMTLSVMAFTTGFRDPVILIVMLCIITATGAAIGSVAGLIVGIVVSVFSRNKE